MSDDLTGIFDHLDPGDFSRPSSAFFERPKAHAGDPFEQFLDNQLAAVRFSYTAAAGAFNPMCILASASVERMFGPEPDETMGQYVNRLAGEARTIAARWLFFALKTSVAQTTQFADDPAPDVNDADAIAKAAARGEQFVPAVYFYAEQREPHTRKQGYLEIRGRHLDRVVVAELDQRIGLMDRIFGVDSQ